MLPSVKNEIDDAKLEDLYLRLAAQAKGEGRPPPYSVKQLKVKCYPLLHLNLMVGPTSSGKSFIANDLAYTHLVGLKRGAKAILAGRTHGTLYRNVVSEILAKDNGIGDLDFSRGRTPAMMTRKGAEVYCIGANNEGAEANAQGGSVDFAYLDEPTTYPRTVYEMLTSRARGKNNLGYAIWKPIILTLNPDDEGHYMRDEVEAPDSAMRRTWHFELLDNPANTEDFIETLKSKYTGVFYDRMVLGKWTGDPGRRVIHNFFEHRTEIVRRVERPTAYNAVIGLDPGGGHMDFTGGVAVYFDYQTRCYVADKEFLLAKPTSGQIAKACEDILKGYPAETSIYSDISSILIRDLSVTFGLSVYPTAKDDKDAQLQKIMDLIARRKLIINPDCEHLVRQLGSAMWNKNRTSYERNEKEGHFDLLDALVYAIRNCDDGNPVPSNFKPTFMEPFPPEDEDDPRADLRELAKLAQGQDD